MGFSATDIIEASEKALNSETPEIKKLAGKVIDVGDIVIDAVKTVLLPVVAVNYYAKKAEVYFKDSFEKDILERTKNIPFENIRLPKGNISKNAMNNLAMVLDQERLKEMFLNLLAKSMDDREDDTLYPAFANTIDKLTQESARLFIKFAMENLDYSSLDHHSPYYIYSIESLVINPSSKESILIKKSILELWVNLGLIVMNERIEPIQDTIQDLGGNIRMFPLVGIKKNFSLFDVAITDFGKEFIKTVMD